MGMIPDKPASEADILKLAQDYKHNPNLHVILDPYKDAVLILRAKCATYNAITEMLRTNGIKVSEATVRNFCCRHQTEIKQLRNEIARRDKDATVTPTTSTVTAGTSTLSQRPSFSEIRRPGPKIARDDL
jgi:hypothetical protein